MEKSLEESSCSQIQAQVVIMNTVTVRMYETYDMSTTKNKLGLIAIKTPSMPYIEKRYPGLIRQFKFVHLDKVDVVLSCASSLPADPLQVGTQAGKVAPQDMFNPLLYTAISNDGWNGVLNRIYGNTGAYNSQSGSIRQFQDAFDGSNDDAFKMYYALLSENRFKKAYVQSGLSMRGLVPLVYPVLSTNGQNAHLSGLSLPSVANFNEEWAVGKDGSVSLASQSASGRALMKGTPQRLPRLQTKNNMYHQGDEQVVNVTPSVVLGGIPTCFCGVIVVPPASLNITYFRMTVCWQVTFSVLQSDSEIGLLPLLKDVGGGWVYANYSNAQQTLKAEDLGDYSDTAVSADDGDIHRSVVADGVSLDLVMEK